MRKGLFLCWTSLCTRHSPVFVHSSNLGSPHTEFVCGANTQTQQDKQCIYWFTSFYHTNLQTYLFVIDAICKSLSFVSDGHFASFGNLMIRMMKCDLFWRIKTICHFMILYGPILLILVVEKWLVYTRMGNLEQKIVRSSLLCKQMHKEVIFKVKLQCLIIVCKI